MNIINKVSPQVTGLGKIFSKPSLKSYAPAALATAVTANKNLIETFRYDSLVSSVTISKVPVTVLDISKKFYYTGQMDDYTTSNGFGVLTGTFGKYQG